MMWVYMRIQSFNFVSISPRVFGHVALSQPRRMQKRNTDFIRNALHSKSSGRANDPKCGDSQGKDSNELAIALPILGTYHNSVWETERLLRRDKDPM